MRALVLLSVLLTPLVAHDFWIQPSTHRARPGEVIKVRLMVGEKGKGDGLKRNPDRFHRFSSAMGSKETPLLGLDGSDPAGFVRPQDEGILTLIYTGKPSRLELAAPKFEAYLREEGLESISEARQAAGRTNATGRERFIRSAKALVQVGDSHAGWDRAQNLPLELIPEADPFALQAGQSLGLRALLEGKPLAHLRVTAIDEDGVFVHGRTDAEGRVSLPLPHAGRWILKAVHMRPVTDDPSVDWESLWASLTFRF